MDPIRVIDLKKTILENNDADADLLRNELQDKNTFYVNLMSSPGSGKTSLLLATLQALDPKIKAGVMEADIDSDVDARTILEAGTPAVQLHTGGMCHLDAQMSRQGLEAIGAENLDLVFLENVGNLVCPAEFDTGAHLNAVILAVSEGDDKPLKYPLIFQKCDVVLINKMDAADLFDFDLTAAEEYIRRQKKDAVIFPVSSRTGEGIQAWTDWLMNQIKGR